MTSNLSKLRWRCRRGMRELDVVLVKYLEDCYLKSDDKQQHAFQALLELEDPPLFRLLFGYETSPDANQQEIVEDLKNLFKQK